MLYNFAYFFLDGVRLKAEGILIYGVVTSVYVSYFILDVCFILNTMIRPWIS